MPTAAIVLFVLPFLGGIAVGCVVGRGRWPVRVVLGLSIVAAVAIGHTLTRRNAAGYRELVVLVPLPFAVGAVVVAVAGTIAGIALGRHLRRPR
jgi:ABC-type sulfate transport system permease subunit